MKNKIFKIFCLLFFSLMSLKAYSIDEFNFDITEIEISENGNKFLGTKRGIATSNNGIIINADQFEYYKKSNILIATGDVKIVDTINNYQIYSQKITYDKNRGIILTNYNSKAIDIEGGIEINAENFNYDLNKNIISAEKNATIENKLKNYIISSNFISYLKNKETIYTEGKTQATIENKYKFESSDVTLLINSMELFSEKATRVTDNLNLYIFEKFNYLINKEELKGERILVNTDYLLPTSDKFYFATGIINLKNKTFVGQDTKIQIRKNVFNNSDNDPRLLGVSAENNKNITKINKGVFTSCKKSEKCTPWSIQAKEILHDREKKELVYNNAILKIYNVPILYFPKFFHPDPTVDRRSGFLRPQINNSNTLGNSFSIPYFSALAENKDFTFTPFVFEKNLQMIQNEFRQINKNSKIYANFGFVNNYKSSIDSNKNSIFNLFANYEIDLDLEKFSSSDLFFSIEKITSDTFLKIFDTHIQDNILKPLDYDNLKSELKIYLNNDSYSFSTGITSYENLQKSNNDRYEYIFPYYSFNKSIANNFYNGTLNFSSSGDNIINNTNQIKSKITNDFSYLSKEYITFDGIKSSIELNFKNLNSVGKNNSEYKSSPQIEITSEVNLYNSYPLLKQTQYNINYLTPKILLKFNPSDMKNYSTTDRTINVHNIFNNNRLGINDTLETGKSMTLGLDYKKENIDNPNKYLDIKLASVLRDKEENFIPKKSTLNKKNSNLFGSVKNNFSNFFNLEYNFAIDNRLSTLEYNDISTEFNFSKFTTKFNFLEEKGSMGNSNFLENNTSINFDEKNYLTFKTRRNRKLNLTEYYDLVYEYKNDCLAAGVKYKKTYYEDRDLKPSENLFFTISLIPLTSYEQKIDR